MDTIKASGVLSIAVYDWERFPLCHQTVSSLEDHFTQEDTLRRADPSSLPANLTANAATTPTLTTPYQRKRRDFLYCWTHGLGGHTSADCTKPAPNHVREATIDNWAQHGGNWWMQRPSTYKQVITFPSDKATHRPHKRHKATSETKQAA